MTANGHDKEIATKALAFIPARGGSRRIPRKNIRKFHGKPIIAYSIEAARQSEFFDSVFVTTDDEEIADVAIQYGANIIHRPADMAEDDVGTREVMKHTVFAINDGMLDGMTFRWPYQYVCCIYATAPMMSVDDLRVGFEAIQQPGIAHAISIGYPPLQDAAQFYWSTRSALEQDIEYFNRNTALVYIEPHRICDINTEDEWSKAEAMYLAMLRKDGIHKEAEMKDANDERAEICK